jgi:hypothetical protein
MGVLGVIVTPRMGERERERERERETSSSSMGCCAWRLC